MIIFIINNPYVLEKSFHSEYHRLAILVVYIKLTVSVSVLFFSVIQKPNISKITVERTES